MKRIQMLLGALLLSGWLTGSVQAEAPVSLLGFSAETAKAPTNHELPTGYQVPLAPIHGKHIEGLVIASEGNPKTLFLGAESLGLQKRLWQMGALQTQLYTMVFHNKNEYRYGVYGTVAFGNRMIEQYEKEAGLTLPRRVVKNRWLGTQSYYTVQAASDMITSIVQQTPGYRLHAVSDRVMGVGMGQQAWQPGPIKGSLWARIDANWSTAAGGHFADATYILVYDDPDYGPAARFVVLNERDVNLLWPRIEKALFR